MAICDFAMPLVNELSISCNVNQDELFILGRFTNIHENQCPSVMEILFLFKFSDDCGLT